MHRRFAALAASVLLLNLNVIGTDRACGPRHDVTQAASHEHAGHTAQHAPAAPAQHDAPSKCCDAISSCGMTLSLGGDIEHSSALLDDAAAPRFVFHTLSSVPHAPEPPPPRG